MPVTTIWLTDQVKEELWCVVEEFPKKTTSVSEEKIEGSSPT